MRESLNIIQIDKKINSTFNIPILRPTIPVSIINGSSITKNQISLIIQSTTKRMT